MRYRTRARTLIALSSYAHYRGPGRRDAGAGDTGDPNAGGGGGTGSTDDDQGDKGAQDSTGKTPKIVGDFDKERHERALAAARDGEKNAKAAVKAANDRVAAILKAAGLTPDGKTDPAEQLKAAAEERDKATTKARDTAIELAVYKAASKPGVGADADAVLDSRGFRRQVADLDPDAADFNDKVIAAIKDAVKANSKLAATPAGQGPARQGADITGGGNTQGRPANLREAFARKQAQQQR